MATPIPSISAKALSGMPQFVLGELGEKGLSKVFDAAGLPLRFLDQRDGYIPEQAASTFFLQSSRLLGEEQLGLMLSPAVSVRDYGAWGAYVLSAPTLGSALLRMLEVMPFHSNNDRAKLRVRGNTVRFSYLFALRGDESNNIIAYLTLAGLLDILRQYLGSYWIPDMILIDCPKPAWAASVEDQFGCPVLFDSEELTVVFSIENLRAGNKASVGFANTTVHDISRERASGPPSGLVQTVRGIVFQQLIDQKASLENASRMLDMGTRRLQRALEREGTSFRQLSNSVVMERATELLGLPGVSVSSVASKLGYSSPTNFSRAFKKEIGHPPGVFVCK
jgi:AraC-like DNA-binding protein